MALDQHTKVSSLKAITLTITNDYSIYRWFSYLLLLPPVIKHISLLNEASLLYKDFYKSRQLFNAVLFFLLCLIFIIGLKNIAYGTLLAVPLVILLYKIYLKKKRIVSQLSDVLLTKRFTSNELSQKTLYEVSEELANDYGINSIVDVITGADNACRTSLFILIILNIAVLTFKGLAFVWLFLPCIIVPYFIIYLFLHSRLGYRFIK